MPQTSIKELSENAREFGLRSGRSGPHSSRTISLHELEQLLEAIPVGAEFDDYQQAIVEDNLLDKSTDANRKAALRRLRELYTLDPAAPIFRIFRQLWSVDASGRPLLAMLVAYARDPLLRSSAAPVLETEVGTELMRHAVAKAIDDRAPGRMNDATIDKVARNVSSSWSQAGHLVGRVRKIRQRVTASPANVAFALLLGFVNGLRGKKLLSSEFIQLLDIPDDVARARAIDARRLGLIELRESDDVFDVGFRPLLTERELRIANGTN